VAIVGTFQLPTTTYHYEIFNRSYGLILRLGVTMHEHVAIADAGSCPTGAFK